ncbi:hypothetical protein [Terriglobus aquaticus]|uniref:Uncharacterized protein n=1 Tax=Terriglobus aquaticus TaxID=940139 RepID=A0ABW9KR83_9BACT|nr:hypothetical protein [Terriglobus aquaticus]
MRTIVQDKYFLRDLHREIDLYDRKLVHLNKHEAFDTQALRDAAIRKLVTKRDALISTARTLHANGVEYADHELPRCLRPEGWVDPRTEVTLAPNQTVAAESRLATDTALLDGTASATMNSGKPASSFGEAIRRLSKLAPLGEDAPLAAALGSWQDDLVAYKKKRRKSTIAA